MRFLKPKILNEALPLASYILIESTVPLDEPPHLDRPPTKSTRRTYKYSLSTLIIPTKEPRIVTTGHIITSLLTEDEIAELNTKEYINLNKKKLKSTVKFFLHLDISGKSDYIEHDEGHYLYLEPEFLLFPKEIAKTFGELFKYKMKSDAQSTYISSSTDAPSFSTSYPANFCIMTLKPVTWDLSTSPHRLLFLNGSDRPYEGQPVYLVASPFAQVSPKIYKNAVHVSHISKVASCTSRKILGSYKRDYLFLIHNMDKDGEEGAPVFNQYYEAIGIILGSIAPYKEDSIGFSVCLGISCALDLFLKATSYQNSQEIWNLKVTSFRPFLKKPPIRHIASRIVKVITSSNVGSGVLLSHKGFILTNRHVVQGHENLSVEISVEGQDEVECYSVTLFVIAKGDMDVALLKVTDNLSDKVLLM